MNHDGHKGQPHEGATASVRPTRFSVLWIIPLMAVVISCWLAWHHLMTEGPSIVLTFDTADGIVPGQTQVKDKAVTLGMVRSVALTPDMRHANVTVQMNAHSANYLTDHARFWVVRPRINGTSITGLETLLSGAYIAFDPGSSGGKAQRRFMGLETPPGMRSDQSGSIYWLMTGNLNSLGPGSPIFYRDLAVGEVLEYTMPPGGIGPILVKVFVREPYNHYLHVDSRFWNVSGLQVGFGAGGLQVRLQSLQALFSGGVAFGRMMHSQERNAEEAVPNSVFRLYGSREEADNTRYRLRLPVATYVDTSVGNLAEGSKVTMFGLQVGVVTGVHFQMDVPGHPHVPCVRVDMEIEPGRVTEKNDDTSETIRSVLEGFVAHGMRASVQSVSFLTGEAMVALAFTHKDKPGKLAYEQGVVILPSEPGGMDGVLQSVSSIAGRISAMPLTQIGDHLNALLKHSDETIHDPEVKRSMVALRQSLQTLNSLLNHADERLPAIMQNLQETLHNARLLLASYGGDTDFRHDLQTLVIQLSRMARSVQHMTDYINQHPSAFITGRRK